MSPLPFPVGACLAGLLLCGCATRSVDVKPLPADPASFASWPCERIDDEIDTAQQRAADVAYTVDERVGNNIVALGVGIGIFWPAMFAMRPDGLKAKELAGLKGRYEALRTAAVRRGCPPAGADLSPERAAALPVAVGDRLVYDDRVGGRSPGSSFLLRVAALRRDEIEFWFDPGPAGEAGPWRQDRAGNITAAPAGTLQWRRLLKRDLALGQVLASDITIVGDPLARARVRGQVVAVGPQVLADRRFDVAVIDLFGDAQRGDSSTRLDGAIVVDRASGVMLRLDLRSAIPGFNLQRRLERVERPGP